MEKTGQWNHKIFNVSAETFTSAALEIFHYQYANNPVYRAYTDALDIQVSNIAALHEIPYLPVSFFKTHKVISAGASESAVFESSGTTGMINSKHFIRDLGIYEQSFFSTFETFYGPVKDYCIIGLLPSYLERSNSSLVYMVRRLIEEGGHPESGFYLNEYDSLAIKLRQLMSSGQKLLLIGVTFALVEFAEKIRLPLMQTIIVETGGMKGRRNEMVREEVHQILKGSFHVGNIHSEYGMTELLSQAWSAGNGLFNTSPWMRVLCRDEEDPFRIQLTGSGALNIIDLANVHSCSFIATDDVGRIHANGSFEVLGRIDGSDLRGCSLMVV